jgi:NDP-sugar pyrophosphorylase family protein
MSKNVTAVILAAGKGSRMQPFTNATPKPLAQVNSKTLLEYNMDPLVEMVDEFVIVVHWLKTQIMDYIGSAYKGIPVTYAVQENPKGGTLNAFEVGVAYAQRDSQGFIVANADNILGAHIYTELFDSIKENSNIVYAVSQIVYDREALKSFGVFVTDEQHQFVEIVEKPKEFVSDKVNIGLYYFPSTTVPLIQLIDTPQGQEEYITDLLNISQKHMRVQVIGAEDVFIAVTTMEDIALAEKQLRSLRTA